MPIPGKPRDPGNVDVVHRTIESERSMSQKQISLMYGPHSDAVKRVLCEEVEMREVNCRWIPHALSSS
jgi:hypothetical protein